MTMQIDAGAAVETRPADTSPAGLRKRDPSAYAFPVLGSLFFHLYAIPSSILRRAIIQALKRLERTSAYSITLRRIFAQYHGIEVGMYSHGGWCAFAALDSGTTIGRYCSIASTASNFTHNHTINTKSTSPLFSNPVFGVVPENIVPRTKLVIGNDVWIGHNAIILPSVKYIGDGAIIGAGAVVHKDVPPFGIVTGHPSRVVRYRFSEKVIAELLASKWWEKSIEELRPEVHTFLHPLEDEEIR